MKNFKLQEETPNPEVEEENTPEIEIPQEDKEIPSETEEEGTEE